MCQKMSPKRARKGFDFQTETSHGTPLTGNWTAQQTTKWRERQKQSLSPRQLRSSIMPFMQQSKLVVVHSYGSRAEADLAKGALEDAGIQAMVQADTAGGMREHLAWSGAGFKVLVREEDRTEAGEVLAPPAEESLGADFQSDREP
jgi:hypothetical protein